MQRRSYLGALCTAGVGATAGCNSVAGEQALLDPSVTAESAGQKALIFTENDEEVGHFGVDGYVDSDLIDLSTEIWHRGDTTVDAIRLGVWMPETATETPAEVAVVSPVEGDSSPPPDITLSTPEETWHRRPDTLLGFERVVELPVRVPVGRRDPADEFPPDVVHHFVERGSRLRTVLRRHTRSVVLHAVNRSGPMYHR